MLKQSCAPKQNFIHLIPLIDVLAYANGIKSVNSKRVITKYKEIIKHFATEINHWQSTDNIIENSLKEICSNDELYSIIAVKNQKFTYNPPGFDGLYGKLEINNKGVALCL